jgi:hypothetical protein
MMFVYRIKIPGIHFQYRDNAQTIIIGHKSMYDTQYKEQMYIYNVEQCLSGKIKERVAGIN